MSRKPAIELAWLDAAIAAAPAISDLRLVAFNPKRQNRHFETSLFGWYVSKQDAERIGHVVLFIPGCRTQYKVLNIRERLVEFRRDLLRALRPIPKRKPYKGLPKLAPLDPERKRRIIAETYAGEDQELLAA